MKSGKPASIFALAVMIGIIAYALTDSAWLFAAGFFGCFFVVFISFAFISPTYKSEIRPKPSSKAYVGITDVISHGESRSAFEPLTQKDR